MDINELYEIVKKIDGKVDNLTYVVSDLCGQFKTNQGFVIPLLKWVVCPLIVVVGTLVGLDLSGVFSA